MPKPMNKDEFKEQFPIFKIIEFLDLQEDYWWTHLHGSYLQGYHQGRKDLAKELEQEIGNEQV